MTTKPILRDLPMPIETPRLILRRPTMADAEKITAAKQAVWPELQRWMAWAYNGEETLEATIKALVSHSNINACRLAAFNKATGKLAVMTGIEADEDMQYATGYWVTKDFLGQGYATKACIAAVRYGFEVMHVPSVQINYYEGNKASARVIEKMGFTPTRILPKTKARCSDGELLDIHEFIMTDPSIMPPLDVRWGTP